MAGAKVILFRLKEGREMGMRRVVLETDCLDLIQTLREGSKGCSSMAMVLYNVLEFISHFDVVRWSFVKRSGNSVAHNLAHFQP